jgi:hypothetical protein
MVLDRCLKNKGNDTQLLIKWAGWPAELSTWEDEDLLGSQLSKATACGQAVIQGKGNVTKQTDGAVVQEQKPADSKAKERKRRPTRTNKPNVRVAGPEWLRG